MNYSELIAKLVSIEKETGLHLSDTCVDAENAGQDATDRQLYDVAVSAAAERAHDAGFNINELIGFNIW